MLKQLWRTWFPRVEATLGMVHSEGIDWRLTPACETALAPWVDPRPTEWAEAGLAVVVKKNDQRTINHVTLPNVSIYVKVCRVHRPRAWLRELVRPPKAKLEFDHTRALAARGIPVPVPLAWGRKKSVLPSSSYLITQELENAKPLTEILTGPLTNQDRVTLAKALAQFLAQIHHAGVRHPDPHPGNFLAESGFQFTLLDLHAINLGNALTREQVVQELVPLNRWFQARCTHTDRLRFWRAYCQARQWLQKRENNTLAKDIENKTADSNRQFWTRRCKRYLLNNREYHQVSRGQYRGYAVQTLEKSIVKAMLSSPDDLFRHSQILKDSRTSNVADVVWETPTGTVSVILKRFNVKSSLLVLKNLLRPSPFLRSWILGHNLRDRWLPTPKPLMVVWKQQCGIPTVAYLLVEKVTNAQELPDVVRNTTTTHKRELLELLGRLIRTMHDKGVRHRDLKASNILISAEGEPTLIDLVGVSVGGEVPYPVRVKNLTRLAASLNTITTMTRTDLLRVLRGYLAPMPKLSEPWQSWWKALAAGVQEKQVRNQKTGRVLS